jgi:hypothetical protein
MDAYLLRELWHEAEAELKAVCKERDALYMELQAVRAHRDRLAAAIAHVQQFNGRVA